MQARLIRTQERIVGSWDAMTHFQSRRVSRRLQIANQCDKMSVSLSFDNNYSLINLKLLKHITNVVKKEREASQAAVPALILQECVVHASKITEELFRIHMKNTLINVHPTTSASTATITTLELQQLYLKMKTDLQAQVVDTESWDVMRAKFEKSSTSAGSCRDDVVRKHDHDDHQGDDAPLEGEKSAKRQKTSKGSKSAIGSSSKQQLIEEFQNVDKRVPNIFDRERIEATLRDMLSNQFRDAEKYAYHLEQSQNYMKNQIVWESRQEDLRRSKPNALIFYGPQKNPNEPPRYLYNKDLFFLKYRNTEEKRMYKIKHKKVKDNPEELFFDHIIIEFVRVTTEQQHWLDYIDQIIVMRENDKPYSFSEADFKYLNKNDIEDMYYLCLNKKERVHDFQLGIESYQIKINLTVPTLIFLGIEECDPFSIVDKPTTGFILLNNKNKKRFMDLEELSKFCDANLEKVWNEVKLKIFET
ncbi:hypothetical protein Tco_1272268 [Tanacetum coccineum]